jgi:class 3 adenylate cyclase
MLGKIEKTMSECGSERGVQDVEDWLRTVDTPNLFRLALERHFPSWLIDDMLGGRLRKSPSPTQPIVVLFSDIRDYMTLTDGMEAEQVVQFLNEWFTEVAKIGRRHGGFVDKFIGSSLRQSYTAIGDVVNTAAWLESATKGMRCDILISNGVDQAQRLAGIAETEFVGRLQLKVKGKDRTVPAFQVLGPPTRGAVSHVDGLMAPGDA